MTTTTRAKFMRNALAEVLQRHFRVPSEVAAVERLSGGASQETYRVSATVDGKKRQFALRRAAGGRAGDPNSVHPGLATEADLFRAAREAGVPEPEIIHVLKPNDGLGPGFLLEWLEGETLGSRIVRSDELAATRPKLARQCGEILGLIHSIDVDATGLVDKLSTVTPEHFVRETWANYQQLDTVQPMIDYTALWLLDHLPAASPPQLVHNDFRNGNLMVAKDQGVVAVLDWELSHLGDGLRDLGWICCNSWRFGGDLPVGGFGTREDLYAGYASTSGRQVDRAKTHFWEVFGSFWWAVGTLSMAQHYRDGPDGSVERVTIGRRTSECQMDCVNLLFPGPFELAGPAANEHRMEPLNLAHASELVAAARDFLRTEVLPNTEGRLSFLSRVSANALDVVLREQALDGTHLEAESQRLEELGFKGDNVDAPGEMATEARVTEQRRKLVAALRAKTLQLDDEGLKGHLRQTVAQQLAIDQPRYSALLR